MNEDRNRSLHDITFLGRNTDGAIHSKSHALNSFANAANGIADTANEYSEHHQPEFANAFDDIPDNNPTRNHHYAGKHQSERDYNHDQSQRHHNHDQPERNHDNNHAEYDKP